MWATILKVYFIIGIIWAFVMTWAYLFSFFRTRVTWFKFGVVLGLFVISCVLWPPSVWNNLPHILKGDRYHG